MAQAPSSSRYESIKSFGQSTWFKDRNTIQLKRAGSENDYESVLEIFTKLRWDMFRVSPLFGFEDSEIRLKQYALRLRDHFANQKVQEDVEYLADFRIMKDVGCNGHDKIIKVAVRTSVEEGQTKQIYTGLILSWGASGITSDQFLHLPVLMCRGRMNVQQTVHKALNLLFDCIISPICMSQMDLIWLNGLFLSLSKSVENKENLVKLILHPPGKPDVECKYIILLDHLKAIWNRIHPEDSVAITAAEVKILYDGIIEHASRTSKINITSFKIRAICYNDVQVKSKGQIFCKYPETLSHLLSFFLDHEFLNGSQFEESI